MNLYNSQTKSVEALQPLTDQHVKMYVCGITPYDTTHMGHAFTYVFFDTLKRFLEHKGYTVTYTQNVTDIDDDTLKRAKETNTEWQDLVNFWVDRFLTDMKSLNVAMPTNYVRATSYIDTIIEIVNDLLKKGIAYEVDGTVYFEVAKFKDYGKLSHFSEEQMKLLAKERGADPSDPNKKGPLDFILWQKMKPGEPFWEFAGLKQSKGRPGWHIECSAMIYKTLGERIDIHGGGRDLIYPHHESEIAQSESFTGKKPYVRYWMHTAMVQYEGEKMSKSLGNLVLASELLKQYSPNAIRYTLLSHHYRKPWEFVEEEVKENEEKIKYLQNVLHLNNKYSSNEVRSSTTEKFSSGSADSNNNATEFQTKFDEAMSNDMDTPKALEILSNLAEEIKEKSKSENVKPLQEILKKLLEVMGFINSLTQLSQ